jgi:hypothetical protein
MAIDIQKKNLETLYYYSDDGNTIGPLTLSQLLVKINEHTLVYRDGIEWTNAKDIPEIGKFFRQHKNIQPQYQQASAPLHLEEVGYQTPKKMFAGPFSFNGRIRRLEYGLSVIFFYFLYFVLIALSEDLPIIALGYIPLLWFLLAQGAKRCHDNGNSGWFQSIPFYFFWMIFSEGDLRINAHGAPPK